MSKYAHWSSSLRRAFVKDYSIPITVVQDPYFEHQMLFLDAQFQTLEKAELLNEALFRFKNEDEFHRHIRVTREKIVDDIKVSEGYKEFQGQIMGFSIVTPSIPKDVGKKVYTPNNIGIDLVSLDLSKANFNILRYYSVLGQKTYRELVSKYTDLEYFIQSKKIRQVIFGNLNPKRQMACVRLLMKSLTEAICKEKPSLVISSLSHDEVVFKMPDGKDIPDSIMSYLDALQFRSSRAANPIHMRLEKFKLEKLDIPKSAFLKRLPDNSFKLKCCPGNYTLEVLRHLYGQEPHPLDRVFYLDGRLCTYNEPLIEY